MRLLLTIFLITGCVFAQSRTAPAPDPAANLPMQEIGPNDLLNVTVYDAPELTRSVRVDSEGYLRLPMLRDKVKAQGLWPAELEKRIAAELDKAQLIVNPAVTVTVTEYHGHPISVMGAVKSPITFQATGAVTLLEALAKAGGLDQNAGPEVIVTAPSVHGQPGLSRRIPVRGLIDNAIADLNVKLVGGEEIRVPEASRVFVVGNVKKPGAFPVKDGADMTVLQVLALAEGLTPFSAKNAYIYATEAGGSRNERVIELRKILDRKAPDVKLAANEILYVPDNKNQRLGVAALEKILLFGSTAGATALIYTGR